MAFNANSRTYFAFVLSYFISRYRPQSPINFISKCLASCSLSFCGTFKTIPCVFCATDTSILLYKSEISNPIYVNILARRHTSPQINSSYLPTWTQCLRTMKGKNYKHLSVALLFLILLADDVSQNPGLIALLCSFQQHPLDTLGYSNFDIIAMPGDGHSDVQN